ncbi:MAG: Pre-mRNA-splicing factor cwc26 [Watsoniomyces obsoletus]|nr:MAG: Pre-mRNA-splicing factor cwc26 [Watsoniomyces obsoletus]
MSLSDYLAKKYLTADPAPDNKKSKKRKRKDQESGTVVIDDDAALDWTPKTNDHDEDGPITVSSSSADFRRAKVSTWKTIGAPIPSEQVTADAIIASAAAENAARGAAEDDLPTIIPDPTTSTTTGPLKMESGAHAGLQSAAQVTAALQHRQAEGRAHFASQTHSPTTKETIYRDASGRIINVAMKRAEARRAIAAAAASEAAQHEAQKGAVQISQRETRRKELQEAKYMTFARYADDEDLNTDLKKQDRWDDPAAEFLREKKDGKSVTGKPLYKGPFKPNRYGIRPGHRWDGVDRGNGFEGKWFAARNRSKNRRELEYAWQMDE